MLRAGVCSLPFLPYFLTHHWRAPGTWPYRFIHPEVPVIISALVKGLCLARAWWDPSLQEVPDKFCMEKRVIRMERHHLGEGDSQGSVTWLCHIPVYRFCTELLGQRTKKHARLQFPVPLIGESDSRHSLQNLSSLSCPVTVSSPWTSTLRVDVTD